jgi:hypothetical protein
MGIAIVWALVLLAACGLTYVGFLLRRRRGGQRVRHQSLNQTPDTPAPLGPKAEGPRTAAVAAKQPSLTVHVQEAVYAQLVRTSEATTPTTARSTVDAKPMLYIHVKATLTPTGKLPLRTIQLLSNGQVFTCTDMPESVLEEEQTLVLHFEAPTVSLGPALQRGASLSYIRVRAPTLDVMSNPFILKPAKTPSQ